MTNKTVCIDEILKSCTVAMKCPRGRFYPNKNFGSHIAEVSSNAFSDELLAYARQAVAEIDGVYVKSVEITGENALFTVLINEIQRQVNIAL